MAEYDRRAISARDASDQDAYEAWSARIQELTDRILAGADEGEHPASDLLTVALHLDIIGREREAAGWYRRVVEAPTADDSDLAQAVMREAVLRLGFGEHERVLELLEPRCAQLEAQYLTAVRDEAVATAGGDLASAVEAIATANASLGRWEAAVRAIDQAKSLRLRYRRALREGSSGGRLIDLERALYASQRGIDADAAGNGATGAAADPLAAGVAPYARVLEAYREARPELPADLVAGPTAAEIAAVLDDGEAAVILGIGFTGTLMAVIARDGGPIVATGIDPDWTSERWRGAVADEHGWLYGLRSPDAGPDPAGALQRLLDTVDAALGHRLAAMLERAGARRAVIVPHSVLHLVPWWALAALAPYEVLAFPSAAQLIRSRSAPARPLGRRGLVVGDPIGDLPAAAAEAAIAARHLAAMGIEPTILRGGDATEPRLLERVAGASVLHFAGHGRGDLLDPLRSALLVAPDLPAGTGDPFPAWVAAAQDWIEEGARRVAIVPGIGRLTEERRDGASRLERRIDVGPTSTLWALYDDDELQALAELWTAGDLSVDDRLAGCALAVLSACESGAGSFGELDEYAGLPAAMQLAGVNTLLCSMWPVADPFAALYVDLFYAALGRAPGSVVDVVALNRELARRVRGMSRTEARERLLELADATDDARAAFTLEAYASRLGEPPFADAWHWAAFYVTGQGSVTKEGP